MLQNALLPLILLLLVQAARCSKELSCHGCVQVAGVLEKELYRPEHVAANDAELAGTPPGRKTRHRLAEGEIYGALEGLCKKFGRGHVDAEKACDKLIDPLKDKLEEFIFSHGHAGLSQLRRELCVDLTQLCSMHQLYDSGEL